MTTRRPLTYREPAQIVRLYRYGFNVPTPVYWFALSQLPPKPVTEYTSVDREDEFDACERERKQAVNDEYDFWHSR